MNNVRRVFTQRISLGNRFYSNNKDLSEEENKKLYEKLVVSQFNENDVQASSITKFLTPHHKFGPSRIMNYDWSIKSIYSWFMRKQVEFNKYNQRYIPDRVQALGSDLAAAHFVVYRDGAIRFRGQDKFIRWTNKKEEYYVDLPKTYEPNYFVEAIDVSDVILHYQGLENFKNLFKLKWLRLRNNPVLDNWCLDYIGHAIPNLEYLDISYCPQVTSSGIAGLHKLKQLKELVVSNNDIEFQMACFALEDINPGLFITIQDNNDTKLIKNDEKLIVNKL